MSEAVDTIEPIVELYDNYEKEPIGLEVMDQSTSVNGNAVNSLKGLAKSAMNGCGAIPGQGTDKIISGNGEDATASNGGLHVQQLARPREVLGSRGSQLKTLSDRCVR